MLFGLFVVCSLLRFFLCVIFCRFCFCLLLCCEHLFVLIVTAILVFYFLPLRFVRWLFLWVFLLFGGFGDICLFLDGVVCFVFGY